jgi:CMP-N,N'-diacetyllegionaminic acid synthase
VSKGPTAWALVPARGGSKSIPLKNLVPVAGMPLMSYGIHAALASGVFERIVCSTESAAIAEAAHDLGIEIDHRPAALCADDTPVADVAQEFLGRQARVPDVLVLVQPTSPFLRPDDIRALLAALAADPECRSAHNVTPAPHNFHPWNAREVVDGRARFVFTKERSGAHNKQRKPKWFFFGNLVAARSDALIKGEGFFAPPIATLDVPLPCNSDLDQAVDIAMAEALIEKGLVPTDDSAS